MYILALETTGKYGSASVIDESGQCVTASSREEMNHLKEIITLTEESIERAGITKADLTHVAASVGPGSFTGIRIGVTTARTLGQVMNLPCISASSLEGMALHGLNMGGENRLICPIINARRHQTYSGVWKVSEGELESILPEKQYMIEDLLSELQELEGSVLFIGDGIDAYENIIAETLTSEKYSLAGRECRYPDSEWVAKVALRKALQGETCFYKELLPNYMRKSEAEMRLEAGTLSRKIHG
ncbi:MAG: tRNA (adenosine(37)-N6)-threonylcarbamoyltransferase complex dimerization subunit type 1 TsaB [Eubacteriales bacterium]|nr:tRNA (adenosine(37)-N6)-threonylcarbamoyltransferase complex dimerization subunit type 1 TsaB [Eubacteriales bacterium]